MSSTRWTGWGKAYLHWLRFVGGTLGCFYVLMTLSLVLHEVLGHGLAAWWCGADWVSVKVAPAFYGSASHGPLAAPELDVVVRYAGIGLNAILGGAAWLALRGRPLALDPTRLSAFWFATTQSGHALAYTLQGLLFRQGDGRDLSEDLGLPGSLLLGIALGLLLLLLFRWALTTLTRFVQDHYQTTNVSDFRRAFLLSFTLPIAVVILLAPGLPGRSPLTRLGFEGSILVLLILGSGWLTRRLPSAPTDDCPNGPISGRAACGWFAAAVGAFLLTTHWLSAGVTLFGIQ